MKIKILFVLCLLSLQALAQTSGTVTNEKRQLLPAATVQLYRDNKPFAAKLTDANGHFTFAVNADYLVVSYIGYLTDTIRELKPALFIILQPDAKILKEVTIQAKQPILRQETDRTVITVNEQVKKLAENGLEIVSLAPGITISDNEDAIIMSGKADVQVMINDKVVKMSPRDLAKFLKAMPSGSIRAVEVMSNPAAKYEVNGNTGIINIRTNSLPKGFNGNLDYTTSQSRYNWSDLSGILNYGSGKFAVSAYGAWHTGGYLTKSLKNRQLTQGAVIQQNSSLDKWNDPVFRVTLDYQLNKRSTIGGMIEREVSTNTASYTNNSQIDDTHLPDSAYITRGYDPYVQYWNTYNINYRYNDTIGNEVTTDLDRAAYAGTAIQQY
jgi:iron complex outermembrane receptor protein